jgi:hypothetical protein
MAAAAFSSPRTLALAHTLFEYYIDRDPNTLARLESAIVAMDHDAHFGQFNSASIDVFVVHLNYKDEGRAFSRWSNELRRRLCDVGLMSPPSWVSNASEAKAMEAKLVTLADNLAF